MELELGFGALPEKYNDPDSAQIIVIPVAFDGTSTWVKGADKGPDAILEASANMELYDIETDSQVYKRGIYTAEPFEGFVNPKEMVDAVQQEVEYYLDKGKFVVTIGGEHSISIGPINAHAEKYPTMTVLQLDAHSDLRQKYENSKYNHACVMARAKEKCKIVQVAIRSMDISEKQFVDNDTIFYAKDIQNNNKWMDSVIEKLSDQVYITIDLDAFDPSIMPSTGTPEPGGMKWYQTLEFLKTLAEQKQIVGFDVNELCPNKHNKAPDFLAAKLIYKMLSYIFEAKNE